MLLKSKCIVLRVIRFKDTKLTVTALIRELGRLSFIVADGKGREASRRRAMLIPGTCFEAVVDVRDNRQLQTFRDPMPTRPMLLDNPAKGPVILFICDFLNALLRDNQPDALLFDYADKAIADITSSAGSIANWPICFLIELQSYMGIEPDGASYSPGALFDMANGVFRQQPLAESRFLDPTQSAAAACLLKINRRNMRFFKFTRQQRAEILDRLIEYYSMHCGGVANLNSVDVLRSLFA